MNRVFGLFLLLACAGQSQASYCYTPSYPQSYSGYSYYQQPSYYQYQPYYVSYPVASYVGIPIPIFGSVYTGPNGAAQTQTTTTTRTATATQTVGTATTAATPVAATTVVSSDTQQILSSLKTLTGLVGQVAQKQEQHDARLLVIERRHSELLKRFAMVESRVSGPATGPVGMPKAEAIPQTWALRCGVCHQNGNESKGGGFVLLGIGGVRASLTAKQAQKLLRSLTAATMPPKDNKEKVPPLTNDETSQLIEDIPNFPIKKE